MFSSIFGRAAALLLVMSALACRDATPPAPMAPDADKSTLSRRVPRAVAGVTPAQFHARNRMDYVGVAHNKAMDEIRREVRASRPRDICKVIRRVAQDTRLAPVEGGISAAQRQRVQQAAIDGVGCRGKRNAGLSTVALIPTATHAPWVAHTALRRQDADFSPAGWELLDQIGYAAEAAASSTELAGMLAGISQAAQSLSADEAAAIDAVTSVALSSFEYWEQNGTAAAAEIAAAYDDCLSTGGGEGCVYATARRPSFGGGPQDVKLASYASGSARECEYNWGFVARGDVWGASVGLALALKFAKTWQTAVAGVAAGAVAGSGGANVIESVRFFNCIFTT